jgi:hypothetical protein
MAPAPHLLFVNSRPTLVSSATWQRYYTDEHLYDLVSTGTSKTAALYEEIDIPRAPGTENQRKWLAIYQTDFSEPLNSPNAKNMKWTSEILSEDGKHTDAGLEHTDPDTRNYKFIQAFDPHGVGEGNSLHSYLNPIIIAQLSNHLLSSCHPNHNHRNAPQRGK